MVKKLYKKLLYEKYKNCPKCGGEMPYISPDSQSIEKVFRDYDYEYPKCGYGENDAENN